MHEPGVDEARISELAIQEFDGLVAGLRGAGVEVLVYQDERGLPDCVFPNNWMSWHTPVGEGFGGEPVVVTYPMCDELRRAERSVEVLDLLVSKFGEIGHLDLSGLEDDGEFLEGTGSLVLDRVIGGGWRLGVCRLGRRWWPLRRGVMRRGMSRLRLRRWTGMARGYITRM